VNSGLCVESAPVDPVDAADDGLLEVELERDAQGHRLVVGVVVGAERPRRGATVHELEHRGLDLDVALVVEGVAQRTVDVGAQAHHVAGLLAHDEVGVALAHAGLLGEVLVQRRQGAEGLAGHHPARRHHRQLTLLAGDDAARHGDVVAEVDQGLPVGERLLTDLGEADHHLQAGADALLKAGEAELAADAAEDDPAGHGDDVLRLLAGLEVAPLPAHVGEGVGAGHVDGVGRVAGVEQPLPLLAAHPHLLGHVVLGRGGAGGGGRGGRVELVGHPLRLPRVWGSVRIGGGGGSPRAHTPSREGLCGHGTRIADIRLHVKACAGAVAPGGPASTATS